MPRQPPIPPGPPTPADAGGPGGRPLPDPSRKDKDREKRSIPDSLAGYGFDKKAVREIIEKHFRVYDERDALPGFDRALLVAFYVMAKKEDIQKKLPELQEELTQLDPQIQPMLREEGGETLLVVARRPREARAPRSHLPALLALLTLATVTLAGAMFWMSYGGEHRLERMFLPENLLGGLVAFTLPMAFYFGAQETARRIVAARHGLKIRTSLLVPVPPVLFIPPLGTFGGISNPLVPAANRRVLFDLAAAGPLAGFGAAVLVLVLGFTLTLGVAVPTPDDVELEFTVQAPDGTTWREGEAPPLLEPFERSVPEEPHFAHNISVEFRVDTAARGYGEEGWRADVTALGTGRGDVEYTFSWWALDADGEVTAFNRTTGTFDAAGENVTALFDLPPGHASMVAVLEYRVPDRTSVPLGEPLAFTAVSEIVMGDRDDLLMHPTAVAGWTALFVTGITLLPVGRLDGGGIARAVFAHRMPVLGYVTIAGLVALTLFYAGWVYLLLIIVLFLSVRHGAPLDESTPLDTRRHVLAVVLAAILAICFVPFPARLPGLGFLG